MDFFFNSVIIYSVWKMSHKAIKSLYCDFTKKDTKVHGKYVVSKFLVWVLYLMKTILLKELVCGKESDLVRNRGCFEKYEGFFYYFERVWLVFEVAFIIIAGFISIRIEEGSYEMIGGTQIYFNGFDGNSFSFENAINIEIKGVEVKNPNNNVPVEIGLFKDFNKGEERKKK